MPASRLRLIEITQDNFPRTASAGATPPSGPTPPDALKLALPGNIISTHLMARGSAERLAQFMPERQIKAVLNGRIRITPDIANCLSAGLGLSPMFFMNLQAGYDTLRAAQLKPNAC